MKHSGSCICGNHKFETELDPMLIIQCNCTKCRKLSGSYQIGCLYSVSELRTQVKLRRIRLKAEADI